MLVNVNGKIRSLDDALNVLVNFVERLMKSCVSMDSHTIWKKVMQKILWLDKIFQYRYKFLNGLPYMEKRVIEISLT